MKNTALESNNNFILEKFNLFKKNFFRKKLRKKQKEFKLKKTYPSYHVQIINALRKIGEKDGQEKEEHKEEEHKEEGDQEKVN